VLESLVVEYGTGSSAQVLSIALRRFAAISGMGVQKPVVRYS
jgi:hypothetical protein